MMNTRLREMTSALREDQGFVSVAAVLFVISAAVTVLWCGSMAAMPGMDMPGGWTMSMAWMRMPGQSWGGAAGAFLGMWVVMMVAMMLPVIAPRLVRYRSAMAFVDAAQRRRMTFVVALAYFGVWVLLGAFLYPLGLALAEFLMRSPALSSAAPALSAIVLVAAGTLQFTAWKARLLECCRATPEVCCATPATSRAAWWHGWHLGMTCVKCCAGHTALLLVLGIMDLRAMALVTSLIALERLAPEGQQFARGIGALLVVAGLWISLGA
jgi:predicted metal-binding membrane protein